MNQTPTGNEDPGGLLEIEDQRRIIFHELVERIYWFIRFRWLVPPAILAGAVVASLLGFDRLPYGALVLVAISILIYNVIFYLIGRKQADKLMGLRGYARNLARWQFCMDYIAMFLLLHFTGGVNSPLIFLFIFHIIFASILLPHPSSFAFATMVVAGMAGISLAEYFGWLTPYPLVLAGGSILTTRSPYHMILVLGFFTASVYITAFFTTSIMRMLRNRISNLVDLSDAIRRLNEKMNALYAMTQAIVTIKKRDSVLQIVTTELSHVMGVLGISVKLLSEDGKFLHFVAANGLVADVFKSKVVDVSKSPLNRKIIEGKPFVTGSVTRGEMFQFGEDLAATKVKSVLFVPLPGEKKVIGILGAYSEHAERFTSDEVEFFRQAAGLVAVAIENAQSYEAIERLIQERSWFMMKVAHNLRSPLAAVISILDVIRGGYQGGLSESQHESLRRVDRRARTMLSMIDELLNLAQKRDRRRLLEFKPVNLSDIAGRIQRTHQDEANQKGLKFEVVVSDHLPQIQGDPDMLEQAVENLVSNAIKYSLSGGQVRLEFSGEPGDTVRIQVSDTGIGIPKDAKAKLFTEFYRAENARAMEEHGTGLGLAIVKEIVNQHGGRIIVESEEGLGTLFVVSFPTSASPANLA